MAKPLSAYKAEAKARNAKTEKENEERMKRYRAEQQDRIDNGEAGLRPTSFVEIPGAHETKKNLKSGISKMDMPGAKLAAGALDILAPESLTEISAPVMRGIKKLSAADKYAKTGKVFEKTEDAGKLKKASEEIREKEFFKPGTIDYKSDAMQKPMPSRREIEKSNSPADIERRLKEIRAKKEAKKKAAETKDKSYKALAE